MAIDGSVAIVSTPFEDDGGDSAGAAYVFRFDGTSWFEEAKLTASDAAASDGFGWSVAVSGEVALIGAPGDDDACDNEPVCESGSVYVFRFDPATSGWHEEAKLTASALHWRLVWTFGSHRGRYSAGRVAR